MAAQQMALQPMVVGQQIMPQTFFTPAVGYVPQQVTAVPTPAGIAMAGQVPQALAQPTFFSPTLCQQAQPAPSESSAPAECTTSVSSADCQINAPLDDMEMDDSPIQSDFFSFSNYTENINEAFLAHQAQL